MYGSRFKEDRILFPNGNNAARTSSIVSANLPANGILIINNNAQSFGVKVTATDGNSTTDFYFTMGPSTTEGPLTVAFDQPIIQAVEITPIANPDTDTTGLSAGSNPVTSFTAVNTAADCIVRLKLITN